MKALRLLILILVIALVGCKDHKETVPEEISDILGLKIDRPLEVTFCSPQGKTSGPGDYESVTIVFNQPMKALSAQSGPSEAPFRLEPKANGRFRWKGTATVSFEPEAPLRFGTKYKVIVPKGLKAPGGSILEKDYEFEFQTPGPQISRSQPKDGERHHKAKDPIYVEFDQNVDVSKVLDKISLKDNKTNSKVSDLKVELADATEIQELNRNREDTHFEIGKTVALRSDDLKPNTLYSLKLEKGLVGSEGPLPSDRDHTSSFTTLGPLKWTAKTQTEPSRPGRAVYFRFNNSVNAKSLKEHLKVEPELEIPIHEYDEDDSWTGHSFYLAFEPNTTYTFTIDGKLKDTYGQELGQDVQFSWKTEDRSPLVNVPEGIAVLEAKDTLTIPMGLRNVDEMRYRMAVLDRQELASLLTAENRDWLWGTKAYQPNKAFAVNKSVKLDGPRNELYTEILDLREVLKDKTFGFVYYQVELKAGKDTYHRRGLAQVTNIGATGKFSPENSLFFASSLDESVPQSGIEASVLDNRGRAVWRGETDEDGRLEAPGWSKLLREATPDDSNPTLYLFLKQGEDEVYVENGGFGRVSTWQFDIPFRWSSSLHHLESKVYSERGLYRPNEEVHLKGSLRDREGGDWVLPQISKLDFVVKDSRDSEVEKGSVSLSEFGTFHHTVKLNEKSPTGSYRVDYSMDKGLAKEWGVYERVAGATFRVEEFEAAQFEVTVKGQTEAAVMNSEVEFEAEGMWLFGAPMADAKAEWTARVEPAVYHSKEHPGFDFGPSYSGDEDTDETKTLKEGKLKTDSKGLISEKISLRGIPYKGDADLVIETTITSSNRRSITGSKTIPVSRGEFRIGLKPQSRFLPAEAPVSVQLLTLSPEGEATGGKSVELTLLRREWNSVRKSDVDGRFRWITEVDDHVVQELTLQSNEKYAEFQVTPKKSGYYIIRAKAKDEKMNNIVTETSFYAHGSGYVPWGRAEGDSIELVADKSEYGPGETAKLLIKNPFEEATALVTYERDLILHSYSTQVKGSAPVIEVPLDDKHIPNLYVSVMLFRGRVPATDPNSNEDTGKPAFKMGYADLKVSPESKRLKVEIETEKKRYGPGDPVTTKVRVTDSGGNPVRAELSLTAADVGVLNLINFQTPDLFDTYYGSLALAVRTVESRMDVIGQRTYGTKGENEGGGGGYSPAFRKDFKSTALWEPQVVTNSQGVAEVEFDLPENLTTFRLMATAITADTRCGSAEHEIINSKDLVLKPSKPAFARVGDEFQAGVLVVNSTEEGGSVSVSLNSEGIKVLNPEPRDIYLKAGEEREVLFDFVVEKEGKAILQLAGDMDGETDGVQYEIPLEFATQRVNLAHTGRLSDKELKQPLEVPESAKDGTAKIKLKLSSSILLGLEGSVQELLDYPYGCLEQRLSRITPLLFADTLVSKLELKGWHAEKVKVKVQESLDLFATYADENSGGLKVWPDSKWVHPYLTARAVRVAHQAKAKGYKINGVWLDRARAYLKAYLYSKEPKSYPMSKEEKSMCRAACLEALTRFGFSGKSELNKLMDERVDMPAAGKALLLQAAYRLDQKESVKLLAQELTNSVKIENATAYFDVKNDALPWLYSSDVRDSGIILKALLQTEQDFPLADKVVTWLLEARNDDGTWGNTARNAASLEALVAYAERFEGKDPSFEVKAKLGSESLADFQFSKDEPRQQFEKELKPKTKEELSFSKDGEGSLYYTIALSYEDKKPSPAKDEGMTVLRSITDLEDKPVANIKGGELYKVHLTVVAPALRRFVVLEDPVPAGLSVVKTDFATESSRLKELLERGSQPSWQTFHRFEDYNDRILLFADALAPGEHSYQYMVRAQTPGTYLHPAAQAEEMYHPELFGRTSTRMLIVK